MITSKKNTLTLFTALLLAPFAALPAAGLPAESNWYDHSFFLLHLDHHTTDKMEVGRDADAAETARLINLMKPDVIQIHAKGNPGWTTYPSKIGFTPPKLARDVMQVWADIARENGCVFSAYYNIGRDREIMKRHPAWNRVGADGKPLDNILCYHSGVAEHYLWPMIDEILERYHPGGFWFDGSCLSVTNCYCEKCRERFHREQGLDAPKTAKDAGWAAYKEMQRQIYREFCAQTAARIKSRNPACLVTFNWAYSLGMPEEPPTGVDYFTGDSGDSEKIAPMAIWYDSQGRPFDQMVTVFYRDSLGLHPKPRPQLEQEMGIIIAHGGRYFAWDDPTKQSGLVAERFENMARVVAPFLRARQTWCLGSRALPDISLFHGAAAHYARGAASPRAFILKNNLPLFAACDGLQRLHLSPEIISDRRLEQGDIRGRLLLLEDCLDLTDANRLALRRYVENGGHVLLTGKAVEAAQLGEVGATIASGPSWQTIGKGEVFCLPQPLFAPAAGQKSSYPQPGEYLQQILPPAQRLLTTNAPETIELVLREKDGTKILHAVNIATGRRDRDPKADVNVNLRVSELPLAPACRVAMRVGQRPSVVTLQPQNQVMPGWSWRDGLLEFELPTFETHQLVVIQPPSAR
jgi:hypothetical protein